MGQCKAEYISKRPTHRAGRAGPAAPPAVRQSWVSVRLSTSLSGLPVALVGPGQQPLQQARQTVVVARDVGPLDARRRVVVALEVRVLLVDPGERQVGAVTQVGEDELLQL